MTYKSKQMKTAVGLFSMLAARDNNLVLVESALLDRDIDTHDILPDNTTGADVQMAR